MIRPMYCSIALSLVLSTFSWAEETPTPLLLESIIYFADSGTGPAEAAIYRANANGSNRQTILSELDGATDLFVDSENGFIYWNRSWTGLYLSRTDLDGNDRVGFESVGLHFTIDTSAGRIYFDNVATNRIQSRNLDGTGLQTIFADIDYPLGISLDANNGKLYWTQTDVWNPGLFRSNIDGSDRQLLVAGGIPLDVELDLEASEMFWIDEATKSILKSNLDGTGIETIISGLNNPRYLALDLNNERLLWSDSDGTIQAANADGTDRFTFATGLIGAGEIFVTTQVVPEASSLILALGGFGIGLAYLGRRMPKR